jgi:hypothetical protein
LASIILPDYLLAEALDEQHPMALPPDVTNASSPKESADLRGRTPHQNGSTDFLVKADLQFPLILTGERVEEIFSSPDTEIPVDSCIIGFMSYENGRYDR